MFEQERTKASFDTKQLSYIIYGSKQKAEEFLSRQRIVENDPILRFDPATIQRSRAELMNIYAKKLIRFTEVFPQSHEMHNQKTFFFPEQVALGLHDYMFLTTLKNLCDQQQVKTILEPAERGQILGCYAQTELGHGSDVQRLMTTATYDPSTETFILHTPETKAAKWWIGDLGVYCTHACLIAQLIIKSKKYGVHAFLVPIRDANHKAFPGVEVGDVGPKLGFNVKDNGYVIFSHYRIPRRMMLMKYQKVSKEGEYSKVGDDKITYVTMLKIRSIIPKNVYYNLSKAIVILTRFSLARRQFKDNKGIEIPILNYQLQQQKIFPRIAQTFATMFAKDTVTELADFVFDEAQNHNRFDQLNEAHTITSGVKAITVRDGLRGLQILRRAAGGHGYIAYSGIPSLMNQLVPSYTYQGQHTVLLLQVARFLLKSLRKVEKGKPLGASVKYFELIKKNEPFKIDSSEPNQLTNPQTIINIFLHHSLYRIKTASEKLMAGISNGLDAKTAWDQYACLQLTEAASAHVYHWLLTNFHSKIQKLAKNQNVKKVLVRLFLLYGIDKIMQNETSFFESGVLTPSTLKTLRQVRQSLLDEIRPDALSIVESFTYTDHSLATAIGASDGKVYQTLLNWARNHNDLNRYDVKVDLRKDVVKFYQEMRVVMKDVPRL